MTTRRDVIVAGLISMSMTAGVAAAQETAQSTPDEINTKITELARSSNIKDWQRSMVGVSLHPTFDKATYTNQTFVLTAGDK